MSNSGVRGLYDRLIRSIHTELKSNVSSYTHTEASSGQISVHVKDHSFFRTKARWSPAAFWEGGSHRFSHHPKEKDVHVWSKHGHDDGFLGEVF